MEVLSVQHLHKKYESFWLKDVSFSMQQGRIMGYIGRNGAGKTTTLKSMLNLVHADSGTIRFFGKDMQDAEFEIKQRIAFIFGSVNYYPQSKLKTISDVYRRFYTNWDEHVYQNYLSRFALDPEKKINQLSQGMSIKFALALALSHHAELFILDEPTSGLDPVSRDELLTIFEDLVDHEGASILFSTHITSDLDKNADDITYIKNGQLLTSQKKDDFVSSFRLIKGVSNSSNESLKHKIIGCSERKGEISGLIRSADQKDFNDFEISPADLDAIMIHTEREV
ncbi:MAG: ABC transporter ATP-binding protein [Anaerolineaceae bacterium]|nr:ABC transporter ATP-binding protein [Anaerolineaceae bacterium]